MAVVDFWTCSSIECLDSPPFRVWEPVARQLRQRRRPTIQRRGRRRQDLRPGTCWQMPFAASFAKFARWFLMQVNLACVKAEQFRCMVLGFLLFSIYGVLGSTTGYLNHWRLDKTTSAPLILWDLSLCEMKLQLLLPRRRDCWAAHHCGVPRVLTYECHHWARFTSGLCYDCYGLGVLWRSCLVSWHFPNFPE